MGLAEGMEEGGQGLNFCVIIVWYYHCSDLLIVYTQNSMCIGRLPGVRLDLPRWTD